MTKFCCCTEMSIVILILIIVAATVIYICILARSKFYELYSPLLQCVPRRN